MIKELDYLIKYLIDESKIKDISIPSSEEEKITLFRALCNIREPKPISKQFLDIQNQFLNDLNNQRKTTDVNNIQMIDNNICLWLGDITTLKIDAIVNAGNEYLLGCFVPNHHCIDNAIHFYSGVQLRLACDEIMKGSILDTGASHITDAFNLPSNYVIHTVGPIIYDGVSEEDKQCLRDCYINSLELAKVNNIRTIAFPSISTGEYHFPKSEANKIALSSVRNYLKNNSGFFDKVIFNVFTEGDYNEFKKQFKKS